MGECGVISHTAEICLLEIEMSDVHIASTEVQNIGLVSVIVLILILTLMEIYDCIYKVFIKVL